MDYFDCEAIFYKRYYEEWIKVGDNTTPMSYNTIVVKAFNEVYEIIEKRDNEEYSLQSMKKLLRIIVPGIIDSAKINITQGLNLDGYSAKNLEYLVAPMSEPFTILGNAISNLLIEDENLREIMILLYEASLYILNIAKPLVSEAAWSHNYKSGYEIHLEIIKDAIPSFNFD